MLPPPSVPIPDTLKGIDDLIRGDFEAFRALWFARLLGATFLVAVGLVMEGPELWHEIHSIGRRWKFGRRFHFSIPEEHAPEWAKLLAFVGWVFIVAGVAGEFTADSFLSRADGYVQKFDEILLADTQKNLPQLTSVLAQRMNEQLKQSKRLPKKTHVQQMRKDRRREKMHAQQKHWRLLKPLAKKLKGSNSK